MVYAMARIFSSQFLPVLGDTKHPNRGLRMSAFCVTALMSDIKIVSDIKSLNDALQVKRRRFFENTHDIMMRKQQEKGMKKRQ